MYNVSANYMNALKSDSHLFSARGTIGSTAFSTFNILDGSLQVKKQCSEGSEVKIGSVYISEMKCTFLDMDIGRGGWQDKDVKIWEGLVTGPNTVEEVPIGTFTIADAIHTATGVQVTAYDSMAKLDKAFVADTTQGTAWSIYSMICHDCGVEKGLTEAQVQALPNGAQALSLYADNDIQTYRDALSWLAQTLGCFAYSDRSGKIRLKPYHSTVDDDLDVFFRYKGCKFSDYATRYTGLSVVEIDDQKTAYYSVTPDNGLTYNLGSNPFLQYGTDATKKIMREAVLGALQAIDYTPFEAEWSSLALYDLGDVVRFPQGLGNGAVGCVMSIEWKFNKGTKVKGFGSNPALASAKSKLDKDIAGLVSQTTKDGIQYYTFVNSEEIDVGDGGIWPVVSIRFTTMSTTKVTFQAEILCDAETEALLECNALYMMNGTVLEYIPTETWLNGRHILSLWFVIEVEENTQYQWIVYLASNGGSIHIGVEEARAAIWGQGLVSIKDWNGYIDCYDTVQSINLDSIPVAQITATAGAEAQIPLSDAEEDTFTGIALDSITVAPMDDTVILNKTSLYIEGMTWNDVKEKTWGGVYDDHTW